MVPVTKRIVQSCAIFLTAIYLTTGLAYLCLDYWSVTQQDFWRIYDACLTNSWLHSALYKVNDHSLFFPSFIWLADLRFYGGNQTMVFAASLALLVVSTGLLVLPIWRDRTVDLTTKTLATLTIIGVSFWMGRADITVSGGFSCIASFVMLGLTSALLLLPEMDPPFPQWRRNTVLLICAGYLASFSFSTGFSIWPCLLFLGWCLRLRWRSLGAIAAGGVSAGLIFHFLPSQTETASLIPAGASIGSIFWEALRDLCRLLGAPILYCKTSWQGIQITTEMTQSSAWLLWSGAAGLLLAIAVATCYLIQRDLQAKPSELIGLGLIVFNLMALLLAVAGRLEYFREEPAQIAAPRYWFWSSLFWAGFLLVALGLGTRRSWMRWPSVLLALAAPIIAWQGHRDEGLHWRYAKLLSEESATSLINDVHDPDRILFRNVEQIDILAPQLRARRLDMFAAGIQDWIDHPAAELFSRDPKKNCFRGQAYVERIPGGPDRDNAVRVVGLVYPGKRTVSSIMVILDREGIVAGVARSFTTDNVFNSLLFGNRMSRDPLRGYIRRYDPANHYIIRSVDRHSMSDQEIQVAESPPQK